jgi:formylglycine-generating enzyme required for sulfatase activity
VPPAPGGRTLLPTAGTVARGAPAARHDIEQCVVPGGTFRMGDAHGDGRPQDGEGPVREVAVAEFSIDATSVTNDAFAMFVAATGYVTDAERYGSSSVFHLAVRADPEDVVGYAPSVPWWLQVRGASWQHPDGPGSDLAGRGDHPAVHVSWQDAQAYCTWAGRALPTEGQWEKASRGGLDGRRYPWGDELRPGGTWRVNIWQGEFPRVNTREDGFLTTAPVRTFEPNGYGLWQTVGNVWEWCQDRFEPRDPRGRLLPEHPGAEHARVLRGGSYLCHDSYCNRYRNAARSSNTEESSTGNAGFRTVAPAGTPA